MSEPTHSHPHTHGDPKPRHHGHAQAMAPSVSHDHPTHIPTSKSPARSALAWPAWLRVLGVLPVVAALWLAVLWANEGVGLW